MSVAVPPLLVHAADAKRVFQPDGSLDRRLDDAAMREIGAWEV